MRYNTNESKLVRYIIRAKHKNKDKDITSLFCLKILHGTGERHSQWKKDELIVYCCML